MMAGSEKNVDLRIRARDEYSKVLNQAKTALDRFTSASQKAAARRDIVGAKQAEVKAAADEYRRLASEIERYRAIQERGRATGKLTANELREVGDTIGLLRNRAREAVTQLAVKRNELNRITGSANNTFLAFSRNADAMARMAAQVRPTTAAVSAQSVAATQNQSSLAALSRASQSVATSQQKARTTIAQTTAAMKAQQQTARASGRLGVRGKGEQQDVEMYGLRPYQMVNLGYQVNDVVSGLMMGQRPMQIFAQQFGQFVQIWPKMMVGLVRMLPLIGALGVAFSPFIAAMVRMRSESNSIALFASQLALLADGANYSAENLARVVAEMGRLGISTKDARAAVSTFIRAGIEESKIRDFVRMSQQLAKVTGSDVPDAAKKLSDAFTGGTDSVRELDKEINFLTADQYAMILAMVDAGDETGALEEAQRILQERLQATSDSAGPGGPWSRAFEHLGAAWNAALDYFANTAPIQMAIAAMNALGEAVAYVTGLLPGAKPGQNSTGVGPDPAGDQVILRGSSSIERELLETRRQIDELNRASSSMGNFDTNAKSLNLLLQEEQRLLEAQRKGREAILDLLPPIVQMEEEVVEVAAQTNVELKDQIDRRREVNALIEEQLSGLTDTARLAALSSRDQYIQTQLMKAEGEARKRNVELTAEQTEAVKAQAAAAFDALEAERERNKADRGGRKRKEEDTERKDLEKALNDLLEYRKVLLEEIALNRTGFAGGSNS